MLLEAARLATKIHEGQKRSDGSPYILHPMRVAGQAMLHEGCEQMVCAAWLHDSLEDQPERTDIDDIRHMFGIGTAILIRELTNEYTKDRYQDWNRKKRKEHEVQRLSKVSPWGQTLKLLDRIDNLQDKPKRKDDKWLKVYLDESESLLIHLVDAHPRAQMTLKDEIKKLQRALR